MKQMLLESLKKAEENLKKKPDSLFYRGQVENLKQMLKEQMKTRKAVIDLNWLDGEISIYEESVINNTGEISRIYEKVVCVLKEVRSKCTPIEQPEEELNLETL